MNPGFRKKVLVPRVIPQLQAFQEFLQAKQRLLEAFETLLPEKSSYEKQDGVTGERA